MARIAFEEVARVDGYEHELVPINRSALSSDGVIAIGQQLGAPTVLLIDRSGEVLGSVGSAGEGPGELRVVGEMTWWGPDTLSLYDGWLRRVTTFSTQTLRHLETISMASAVPTSDEGWVNVRSLAVNPDRSLLFRAVQGGPSSTIEAIAVKERESSTERILLTLPRIDEVATFGDASASVGIGIPWTLRSLVDVSSDGHRIAALVMEEVEGGGIEVTTTEVTVDGDSLFSTSATFDAVPITASEAETAIEERLERVSQNSLDRLDMDVETAYRRAVSLPSVRPAFQGIVVGIDGSVWQRVRSLAAYETGAYVWLDPGGTSRGVGELPSGGRILEADDENVWVEETDAVGVPSLVAYTYSLDVR